jgi:micrococcal nuclease
MKKRLAVQLSSLFVLLLFVFTLIGCDAPTQKDAIQNQETQTTPVSEPEQPPEDEIVTQDPGIKTLTGTVTKVVDGDTAHILINDQDETVRFIGVDTPETKHPSEPIEPYGPEASEYTSSQLQGKTVYLEIDVTERDKYNRLLAYIWLEKPTVGEEKEVRDKMFNSKLLLNGYAQTLTIPPNIKYTEYFTKFQTEAREANKGLWGIEAKDSTSTTPPVSTVTETPPLKEPAKNQEVIVYITNTGAKYHQGWCRYLKKSKISISLENAKARGYDPCSVCNPPY